MRRSSVFAGICGLLIAGVVACAPPPAPVLSAADADLIRATSQAYARTASEHDWSAWSALFAQDAVFLPPNTPAKVGRAEIEAWARASPPIEDLVLEPLEIEGRADLAYVRGRYTVVVAPPGQPDQVDSGKYIEIWLKQADGSWKLFRDIYNSDLAAPEAGMASGQVQTDEQALLQALRTLDEAWDRKDRATMERLMADDYLYIHSNGKVTTRAQDIAESLSGDVRWTSRTYTDLRTRVLGDVGVITGILTLAGSATPYASGPRRFTDLWVKRGGRWQSIGGQATLAPRE